jgi:hypothetical protein
LRRVCDDLPPRRETRPTYVDRVRFTPDFLKIGSAETIVNSSLNA